MTDADEGELRPGDFCHHGLNALPAYRIIWIDEDKAWVRDIDTGKDAVVALDQCRKFDPATGLSADRSQSTSSALPAGMTWPDGTPRP